MVTRDLHKDVNKVFTTKPKTKRRSRGHFPSLQNCKIFMHWLFKKGLGKNKRTVGRETLEYEFLMCFGTDEPRTVTRYLGRIQQIIRNAGSSKMVRMNRTSGTLAQFDYHYQRMITTKKGLLEKLQWITPIKVCNETRYFIHHERMWYYTEQTRLNESKDVMCVSPLLGEGNSIEAKERIVDIDKEKKEEVIGHTHAPHLGKTNFLEKEAEAILNAKILDSEPDKAKVKWNG